MQLVNDRIAELLLAHGYDRAFAVSLSAVPEPTTLTLIGAGLLGLFALRRKLA
jgi:hypothetical protein